jgi:hypothetical protein
LEIFLTQIGPTLPLTTDPPVICFWKWIGWKDYEVPKNRNLESVSAKKIFFFSPIRRLTHPRTQLWTHPANRFPIPVVRVADSVFGQNCPPHGQNGGGLRGGRPAVGALDHRDGREVTESREGSERDRFPSSPWAGAARGIAPTAAAIRHEVAHGRTVGVGTRWCGSSSVASRCR